MPYVLSTCSHQHISAPTPICFFFLYLRSYAAPYSPYTCTSFPVSLHIYKDYAIDFLYFCPCTYSPTIIPSITTTGKVSSLSASVVTFFLYFLKTNNVSGYIMTPIMMEALYDHHLSARTTTTVLRHIFHPILYFNQTSPTYTLNSFRNSLLQNDVPPYIQSRRTSYVLVLHFLHS